MTAKTGELLPPTHTGYANTKPARVQASERNMTPEMQRRRAEIARTKIKTDELIDRLQKHAMGKVGMTPTQVQAAQALLRKTVPDLVGSKVEADGAMVVFNFKMGK